MADLAPWNNGNTLALTDRSGRIIASQEFAAWLRGLTTQTDRITVITEGATVIPAASYTKNPQQIPQHAQYSAPHSTVTAAEYSSDCGSVEYAEYT